MLTKKQRKEISQYVREINSETVEFYGQDASVTAQIAAKIFTQQLSNQLDYNITRLRLENKFFIEKIKRHFNLFPLFYIVDVPLTTSRVYIGSDDFQAFLVKEFGKFFASKSLEIQAEINQEYLISSLDELRSKTYVYEIVVKNFHQSDLKMQFVVLNKRRDIMI